jgi:hypothetical protein
MDIMRKDAADSQLYYEPYGAADFEKTAADIELSQDVRDWPPAILQEFASEHAYAFQASAPEIEFEKVDEKTGTAFGAIILRKPYQVTGLAGPNERLEQEPEKVAVPIIIEAFRLKPFHIFIRGSKIMPLTEARFNEMNAGSPVANGIDPYFQPSPMFMDKMMPTNVGYLGNMYGNYSMGGEGGYGANGKGAQELFEPKLDKTGGSADPSKEHTFIGTLKNTLQNAHYNDFKSHVGDERAMCGFAVNRTLNIVKEILGTKPTSHDDYIDFIEKAAPVHAVCVSKLSGGRWKAVEINDYFYKPVVRELSAAEILVRYGHIEPKLKELMQGTGHILIESSDRKHVKPIILEEHAPVAEEILADGHYLAVTKTGGAIEGQVFTRVLDYSGAVLPEKLFIGGGAYALQEAIVGERMGDVHGSLTNGSLEAGAEGTFVGEQDGLQTAMVPFKVTNIGWHNGTMVAQAVSDSNEHLSFVLMPGVTRFMNATGIASAALGSLVAGNVFFVPPSWHFLAFSKKINLISDPREVKDKLSKKVFFSPDRHLEPFTVETSSKGNSRSLRVISDNNGCYTLRGDILGSIRYEDMSAQSLEILEAHWVLTLLGVALNDCAHITALATQRGEINVSNLRPAKDIVKRDQIMDKNVSEMAAIFRKNLFKEASVMPDPKAADAMLSLNFVNETNLMQFLENAPLFRDVEEKLAELYLYVCLGLKSQIPEQAVLNAMQTLNEVNEHLDYLSAMMRMPSSQAQQQPVA